MSFSIIELSAILVSILLLNNAHAFVSPTTSYATTSYTNIHHSYTQIFAQQQQQQQTSYYAAAGAPRVNMDQYNVPLIQSINEWTAVVQAESSMQEAGIFLKVKDKELFVDTLQYTIKREG